VAINKVISLLEIPFNGFLSLVAHVHSLFDLGFSAGVEDLSRTVNHVLGGMKATGIKFHCSQELGKLPNES